MSVLLQVMGGLFLLLVVVVGFGFLVLRARLRALGTALGLAGASSGNPARITLQTAGDEMWSAALVKEAVGAFETLGYARAAAYTVNEIPNLTVLPFVNGTVNAYGIVYLMGDTVWADVVQRYADGTSITVSNSKHAQGLKHMPGHDKVYLPGVAISDLHRRFLSDRPELEAKPATIEGIKAEFEEAYAKEQAWRDSTGVSDEEIEAIARNSNQNASAEEIAMTREVVTRQANQRLEEGIRAEFLRTTTLSAAEWEDVEDRIVFVHDRLTSGELEEVAEMGLDEEEDEEVDFDFGTRPGRQSFAAYNADLSPNRQFKLIGRVNTPVEADVYAAPAEVFAE